MKDEISTADGLLSNNSFKRWAKGIASKEEARAWDEWCKKSEFNRQLALEAQAELLDIRRVSTDRIDSEKEWTLLYEHIKKNVQKNRFKNQRSRQPVFWWYSAAAVILVAAIVSIITFEVQQQMKIEPDQQQVAWQYVETDYGEQKTINLSDGSSIILNAKSTLKYPKGWVQDRSIEVQLEGEAYFSITKRESPDEPAFKVHTYDGTVQVMGTSFVVNAREKRTRVGLEEGAVRIDKAETQSKDNKEFIRLEPSELAEFSRFGKSVTIKKVNPQTFTSWTRQVLVMDNTPFRDLTDRIRKTYGVKVEVNDPELYERRLTGTANMRSLDLLVRAISEVLEIKVRKSGNTIIFGS